MTLEVRPNIIQLWITADGVSWHFMSLCFVLPMGGNMSYNDDHSRVQEQQLNKKCHYKQDPTNTKKTATMVPFLHRTRECVSGSSGCCSWETLILTSKPSGPAASALISLGSSSRTHHVTPCCTATANCISFGSIYLHPSSISSYLSVFAVAYHVMKKYLRDKICHHHLSLSL